MYTIYERAGGKNKIRKNLNEEPGIHGVFHSFFDCLRRFTIQNVGWADYRDAVDSGRVEKS